MHQTNFMQKNIIWSLVFLFCSSFVSAQTVFHSLEDVWKYADDHNITLRVAGYDYQKAVYAQRAAAGSLLPQINATGSATDNTALQTTLIPAEMFGGPAGQYKPVQFGQKYIYNGGYTAQLDILNLQNWLNAKIARQNAIASKDSAANFRRNVYQQLASQYYSYLLMKEAAALAGRSMLISDSVNQSMARKFSEGLVSKPNADVASINFERARQSFITSQYQLLTAGNNLKLLLDMEVSDSVRIDDDWNNGMVRSLQDQPFADDPGLRLAADQVQTGMLQQRLAGSSFFPVVSVLYSNTTQQNDNKFEPFSKGPEWFPARYWSLKASWQLFNGGSRYYGLKKARITTLEKQMWLENSRKQTATNDANLKLAAAKAGELVMSTKKVMDLAYDNYEHITNRYAEGINTQDDRLSAFSDYITYQNQYLNNLSDLLVQMYLIKLRQMDFK